MTEPSMPAQPAESALEPRTGLASGPGSTQAHGGSEGVQDAPEWMEAAVKPTFLAIRDALNGMSAAADEMLSLYEAGELTAERQVDHLELVVATVMQAAFGTLTPLIADREAKVREGERERIMAALLHLLEVCNPRDRWDEGYQAGLIEATCWIVPGAPAEPADFARTGSGQDHHG